ncbi:hypothetical protein AXA84_0253 [Candidatus Phytoplasma oryzae]|uniref:Uncharacterized protein n=1 Tax=Candidatus Phytoplasma oryzae TaxID=203274 RepID=A0A139JQV2_9MOLU|nr:hypothetical protein [Candidatus Phytoplasma oryzae]KXT29224.1 hypothetical protein AXA84_0253 [Candidatus Phytoplasma oryzae]RAM57711.1 hypothetical protein DH96_02090 [Candidatus Phytoplasma oryzae]
MNSQTYLFSLGFILGSGFTCFLMFLIKKIFFPTLPSSQKIVKLMKKEREKTFQDLSLTIKNLHFNPSEKRKNSLLEEKKKAKGVIEENV